MSDENEKEAHGSKYNYYKRTRLKKLDFSKESTTIKQGFHSS
jgi:hypothetical protein